MRHVYTSGIADGGNAALVQPSNWNDIHVAPYAMGTFTVATGNGVLMTKRLTLTTTQRMTLAGTARLRIN